MWDDPPSQQAVSGRPFSFLLVLFLACTSRATPRHLPAIAGIRRQPTMPRGAFLCLASSFYRRVRCSPSGSARADGSLSPLTSHPLTHSLTHHPSPINHPSQ
eukprot:scaffold8418_cov106-Isochrysis_galbana.AAC.5